MFDFFRRVARLFFGLRSNVQAAVANYLVHRQVANVLKLTHAQELMTAPRNEWPMIRAKQVAEIKAVQSGQGFDIVDRRSWAYPYLPEALHRLNQPILKNTPYMIRRFSETPIPRRAINLIKNAILSLKWKVQPSEGMDEEITPEMQLRIKILTESLKRPNNTDSFRELMEAAVEDLLIGGYMTLEPRMTPYYKRPFKVWAVDGSTIRIFMDWTEGTPDRPRYAQMTGLKGERGIVTFLDSELIYIRDNVRTSTPFGLGKLEVAFNAVNAFLGAQDMAGRAGADQVHKTWLWWQQTLNPAHVQTVRRHLINELEGQAKISLIAGVQPPQVVEVTPVTPEDLLLDWQRFLIDVIAAGFDLSPLALGQTDKVNKATGQVMADSDFRAAVVPSAKRVEEALTAKLIHQFLGWKDLEFTFIGLEDPDALTRTIIQQRNYMMNAVTPDEIRELNNQPPLPGGWGKLTSTQTMLLMTEAAAKLGAKANAAAGAKVPGMGGGGGGTGMGSSSGGQSGTGSINPGSMNMSVDGSSIKFSAQQVAGMSPEDIQLYQEFGILPPTQQLGQQMEQSSPGILDTVTQELQDFFTNLQQVQEEDEIPEAPITPEDNAAQLARFQESEHQEDIAESVINRRGTFGPPVNQMVRKNPLRGKYPRSGGTPPLVGNENKTAGQTTPTSLKLRRNQQRSKSKLPKGNYDTGSGNQYK